MSNIFNRNPAQQTSNIFSNQGQYGTQQNNNQYGWQQQNNNNQYGAQQQNNNNNIFQNTMGNNQYGYGQQQQYGYGQQQQQYGTGNYGWNQQQGGYNQQQQNNQLHEKNLLDTINKIYTLQNQPELQMLLQMVQGQQNQAIAQLNTSIDQTGLNSLSEDEISNLKARSTKIKKKNEEILIKLLNVKEQLTRLMYKSSNTTSNPELEHQSKSVEDRIKGLKGAINQKIHYLKTSNRIPDQPLQTPSRHSIEMSTSLNELKEGTEILERKVIRERTELELVIKHVSNTN